jgi:hypothetical protein
MRQMALPRGESGAKSCRSASSGDTLRGRLDTLQWGLEIAGVDGI